MRTKTITLSEPVRFGDKEQTEVVVRSSTVGDDVFADLRKVMDAPEAEMQAVFVDAQEMSNRTGKSFEDVIAIMTAAAQAGLGKTREELLAVADQAVKMSIAWGVSAGEAGKSMATWQAGMGLTAEQARHTGDVINALSNAMNAEAGEINQIFTRLGPMMKESGLASQDIAALATAFKAAGAEVEVSGTAMKNFVKVMAAGSGGLTDGRKKIYEYLKIDPDELQKEIYADSKSAIIRVLKALKNVRPEERNSLASQLFGEESIAAIAPLMGQLDQLIKAFDIANGKVAGSVDEEYANRMKTSATAIAQMGQSFRNLGVEVGKSFLPVVADVAKWLASLAQRATDLVRRFPWVAKVVMATGATVAALAIGGLALGLVFNTVATTANRVRGLFLRLAASQITASASTGGLTLASIIFSAASRAAGAAARFFAGGLRSILMASGVGALLVALGYGINLLIENWDGVSAAMSSAWGWVANIWGRIGTFFSELGNNLAPIFAGWGDAITGCLGWAFSWVKTIWNGIPVFFANLWQIVAGAVSTVWNGILSFFSAVWQYIAGGASGVGAGITAAFTWVKDGVVTIWNGVASFFSGIWQYIGGSGSAVWQGVAALATWAYNGITSVWSVITGFFSGIVDGIFGVFSGLFGWLKEKFAWVFSTIDSIKGFVGKITGAVSDAWNKAFGDDEQKPAAPVANAAAEKPLAATAPNSPQAPVMATSQNAPAGQAMSAPQVNIPNPPQQGGQSAPLMAASPAGAPGMATVSPPQVMAANPAQMPVMTATPASSPAIAANAPGAGPDKSFAEFMNSGAQKGKPGRAAPGGGGGGGLSSGRAAPAANNANSGPVTIVSVAGDNSKPQTIFIPAGANKAAQPAPMSLPQKPPARVEMPATQSAMRSAATPKAMPRAPKLIGDNRKVKKEDKAAPTAITVDLKQQFDLITSDAAAARKILESIKPDMEALVRRALEKLQSDRRRTAYAQ